jgi:hypothetical protein
MRSEHPPVGRNSDDGARVTHGNADSAAKAASIVEYAKQLTRVPLRLPDDPLAIANP